MAELIRSDVPDPLDTLDVTVEMGYPPETSASCAPPVPPTKHARGVKGCKHWAKCIFAQQKYGAFRGDGPANAVYYLRTTDGAAKMDHTACWAYMQTLHNRSIEGDVRRMRGDRKAELIRVIGSERSGTRYYHRELIPVDALGGNKNGDVRVKQIVIEDRECPKFVRLRDRAKVNVDARLNQYGDDLLKSETGTFDPVASVREAAAVERRAVERDAGPVAEAFAEVPGDAASEDDVLDMGTVTARTKK